MSYPSPARVMDEKFRALSEEPKYDTVYENINALAGSIKALEELVSRFEGALGVNRLEPGVLKTGVGGPQPPPDLPDMLMGSLMNSRMELVEIIRRADELLIIVQKLGSP